MKVTAHLCSVGFREAVALGIDQLEHGLLTNSEYSSGKVPDKCRNVETVFRRGIGFDAPKLRESVKGLVGLR